ncbi:MAG: hypothetical protein HYT19_00945 [Candidatus Nealsonbacteria bacterium]|nr:hypothetical protein [Candidatus Nealsonbacteria bacterium]
MRQLRLWQLVFSRPWAGTHYAAAADLVPRPADSPFYNGPSYLVWEPTGKVIAMEYHINEKYMKEYKQAFPHDDGFRFPFEQFQPGVVFDHITLSYLEHGHPGFEIPHYDIHAYTISSAERNNLICK